MEEYPQILTYKVFEPEIICHFFFLADLNNYPVINTFQFLQFVLLQAFKTSSSALLYSSWGIYFSHTVSDMTWQSVAHEVMQTAHTETSPRHWSHFVAFDYVFSISLCVSPSLFICLLFPVLLPCWCLIIYPLPTCILSRLLFPNWKAELIIPEALLGTSSRPPKRDIGS